MRSPPHAPRILLIVLAAGAGGYSLYRTHAAPGAPAEGSAGELSSLDRRVLMNLEALLKDPAAAGFKAGLDGAPGLRAALGGALAPAERARFSSLVNKHAQDPAFMKAVENPAAEAAPCDAEPAPAPTPVERTPGSLLPGGPAEGEPGCAKGQGVFDPLPR